MHGHCLQYVVSHVTLLVYEIHNCLRAGLGFFSHAALAMASSGYTTGRSADQPMGHECLGYVNHKECVCDH